MKYVWRYLRLTILAVVWFVIIARCVEWNAVCEIQLPSSKDDDNDNHGPSSPLTDVEFFTEPNLKPLKSKSKLEPVSKTEPVSESELEPKPKFNTLYRPPGAATLSIGTAIATAPTVSFVAVQPQPQVPPVTTTKHDDVIEHVRRHRRLLEKHMDPDIKKALRRVCIVIADQGVPLTQHPKLNYLKNSKTADDRSYDTLRGIGATSRHPVVGIGAETLRCGGPYAKQSLLLHELAHAVMDVAILDVRPEWYDQIEQCYDKALVKVGGATKKREYRYTNAQEYWAEGVEAYFQSTIRPSSKIWTRSQLKSADACLFSIIQRVFGSDAQRFCDVVECPMCDKMVNMRTR